MLISEVSKTTGLTKKAVEYYMEQGLVSPAVLDNGYREFAESDIDRLRKISTLRRLGIGTEEIRAVLTDEAGDALQKLSLQKEMRVRREQEKKRLLDRLARGEDYAEIDARLRVLEQSATITEKLLQAFPGYYGRFVCLHFASFLNEPIQTREQQDAYEKILSFLDSVPQLDFPDDLRDILLENTKQLGTAEMMKITEGVKTTMENPDDFLAENRQMIDEYLAYRQSDEYLASPMHRLQSLMKAFNSANGYYDVFIPAMKALSPSYAAYHKQIEAANEKLLAIYPGAAKLNS